MRCEDTDLWDSKFKSHIYMEELLLHSAWEAFNFIVAGVSEKCYIFTVNKLSVKPGGACQII